MPCLQVLFIRSLRVRRFETMTQQDLAQFVLVGLVCGLIWWQVGGQAGGLRGYLR
jgi:hypothetical protein